MRQRVRKTKVYLTTAPRANQLLSNAKRYGKLEVIFPLREAPWEAFLEDFDGQYDEMVRALEEFDPRKDFYLPIGDQVQAMVVAAYLAHRFDGRFTMLVWDGNRRRYEALEVDVGDYDDEANGGKDIRGGGVTGEAG
jgi:predicted transport protein